MSELMMQPITDTGVSK